MRLPRIPKKRTIGRTIERAAREALGPQVGHTALYQHTIAAQFSRMPQLATETIAVPPGGTIDITGAWLWDASSWDGSDAF